MPSAYKRRILLLKSADIEVRTRNDLPCHDLERNGEKNTKQQHDCLNCEVRGYGSPKQASYLKSPTSITPEMTFLVMI